jgi:hypothetical protein
MFDVRSPSRSQAPTQRHTAGGRTEQPLTGESMDFTVSAVNAMGGQDGRHP